MKMGQTARDGHSNGSVLKKHLEGVSMVVADGDEE